MRKSPSDVADLKRVTYEVNAEAKYEIAKIGNEYFNNFNTPYLVVSLWTPRAWTIEKTIP